MKKQLHDCHVRLQTITRLSIFALMLCLAIGHTLAVELRISRIIYQINTDDNTASVTGYVAPYWGSYLEILSSVTYDGKAYDVTKIASNALADCRSLKTIIIPGSVAEIGSAAFKGCTALRSVTIKDGESVLSFSATAEDTFEDCPIQTLYLGRNIAYERNVSPFGYKTSLNELTIGESVTKINDGAFYGCTGLPSVLIPDAVTEIDVCAFSHCSALSSVTIGNGVTEIGDNAFYCCDALESMIIPQSVVSIGSWAFSDCINMESLTISDGVMEIASEAFRQCIGITSLEIPGSVTMIGDAAFLGCCGLTSVTIDDGEKVLKLGGSKVFGQCPLEKLYLGRDITLYAGGSPGSPFSNQAKLAELIIGECVTDVSDGEFSGCSNLMEITSLNPVPPTIDPWTFDGVDKASCSLIVPRGSLNDYRLTQYWKEFMNISENLPTGVYGSLTGDDDFGCCMENGNIRITGCSCATVEIYGADGVLCHRATPYNGVVSFLPEQSGVYIVRCGRHIAKVMVR